MLSLANNRKPTTKSASHLQRFIFLWQCFSQGSKRWRGFCTQGRGALRWGPLRGGPPCVPLSLSGHGQGGRKGTAGFTWSSDQDSASRGRQDPSAHISLGGARAHDHASLQERLGRLSPSPVEEITDDMAAGSARWQRLPQSMLAKDFPSDTSLFFELGNEIICSKSNGTSENDNNVNTAFEALKKLRTDNF